MTSRTFRSRKIKSGITCLLFVAFMVVTCAYADVAVIVNASNNAEFDDDAVARLYLAQVKTFPGGKEAIAVEQKDGSPQREEFIDKLVKQAPAHIKSYWARQKFTGNLRPLRQLASDEEVLKFVIATPGAIGYVDAAKVSKDVRVVRKF